MNNDEAFKICRSTIASIEKQIRASHALGKFIVESVVKRLVPSAPAKTESTTVSTETPSANADEGISGLPMPEAEFALLTSADVVDLVARSSDDEVRAIGAYEAQHRRRRLVIEAVKARIPS